jgi:hypothetical protein
MPRPECEFEADVLAGRLNAALVEHLAVCDSCREAAIVASALEQAAQEARTVAAPPDAAIVWWRATLRARREAARAAARPLTAMQVIAFASAVAFVGACFGATSRGFQAALAFFSERAAPLAALVSGHAVLAGAVLCAVIVVPVVLGWAAARE